MGTLLADLEWHYVHQATPMPLSRLVSAVYGHHIFVFKELVPVVLAMALNGGHWHHSHICFHVDNKAMVPFFSSSQAGVQSLNTSSVSISIQPSIDSVILQGTFQTY